MGYKEQQDRHEDFIRREHRKRNPRSIWPIIGYSILAATVLFGLAYSIFAGHGV